MKTEIFRAILNSPESLKKIYPLIISCHKYHEIYIVWITKTIVNFFLRSSSYIDNYSKNTKNFSVGQKNLLNNLNFYSNIQSYLPGNWHIVKRPSENPLGFTAEIIYNSRVIGIMG